MIYLDNAATTLHKPQQVAKAMARAVNHLGNPGKGAYAPSMDAAREIYAAREAVAKLIGLENPLNVAFTSGLTEAANLLIQSLNPGDHVYVSEGIHNAILRPLRLRGCQVDQVIRPDTQWVFASHGSNVTGEVARLKKAGIPLVLDVAQTLGCFPVSWDMADILLFTGHKALYGPQGVGGMVVGPHVKLKLLKTGGGQAADAQMPELSEAGTPNVPGIAGLRAGVEFVEKTGLKTIMAHGQGLKNRFLKGIDGLVHLRVYGQPELPLVSLSVKGMDSAEAALLLWEKYQIAVRGGNHCAPLMHKALGTEETGLVRFSFSYFNRESEIDQAVEALKELR